MIDIFLVTVHNGAYEALGLFSDPDKCQMVSNAMNAATNLITLCIKS